MFKKRKGSVELLSAIVMLVVVFGGLYGLESCQAHRHSGARALVQQADGSWQDLGIVDSAWSEDDGTKLYLSNGTVVLVRGNLRYEGGR